MDDILDCLSDANYLTKLDLNKGFFHQVPMYQSDIEKTAFCTEWGKYEYLYMLFGLRNSPSTFKRLMDLVWTELLPCTRAYMDDVVIFSTTWDDHKQHLKAVLGCLLEVGLTAKPTKCVWANATCSYLDHVVGRGRFPETCY